MTETKTK